jgi:multidrug efflux pump subunit AcrB
MKHKEEKLKAGYNSFFSFFIRNYRLAFLIVFGLIIWGVSGLLQVPKESSPKIDYGIVVISTFYDGASAVDMDSLVTQEIENKIKDISGLSKIKATSKNSLSSIVLEFEPDINMIKVMGDIRSKVDEAKIKLPQEAEDPNIQEISSANESPFFNIHLSGHLHPVLLRDYAEKLKSYLEKDSNIASIDIEGGKEREIFVDLDPLKLAQYKISPLEINQAIKNTNKDFPIGDFKVGKLNYSLRFEGKHKQAEDIKNIVLRAEKNSVIKIKDIAKVYELEEETNRTERFIDFKTKETFNTVKLLVSRTTGKDIFTADPVIKTKTFAYAEKNFSPHLKINFTQEEFRHVKKSYNEVLSSGTFSIFIVFIILLFFLGTKEAFLASLVIPLSFLSTIAITQMRGDSLNFMVNFSMILSLGILVDTAIVIVEGIYDNLNLGYSSKESAILAIEEFKTPLISGMLTTLAVFLPLFYLPNILGKYLSFIPKSVSMTLSSSLLISLFLIPAIASVYLKEKKRKINKFKLLEYLNKYHSFHNEIFLPKIKTWYKNTIKKFIYQEKNRLLAIYGVVIVFLLTLILPVKFILFPSDDIFFFFVNVRLPEGVEKEETLEKIKPIEKILLKYPEIENLETSVLNNEATITVNLLDKEERDEKGLRDSINLAEVVRQDLDIFKNFELSVKELKGGPPSGSPIGFRVIADDYSYLKIAKKVSEDLQIILNNIEGTSDVKDDLTNIPGEMTYIIDREEALRLGVDPSLIALNVRTAVSGIEASQITREGREIKITLRYLEDYLKNFNDIDKIQILNNKGQFINLKQVVKKDLNNALSEIKRYNQKIAFKVSSDITKTGNALEITKKTKEELKNYQMPEGISVEDAGENAENKDLFMALAFGAFMAVFLIFTILVVQFNSFSYPFIIIFTILMSLIGVNIGLFITGTPRSLAFIIGVISLGGIVVNDAIILVDKINNMRKYKKENKDLGDIIAQAGASRLQPIILTTLTTTAGVLPLIWVNNFWAGLANTIIFGLCVASSLTLFVTPLMYYQFNQDIFIVIKRLFLFLTVIVLLSLIFYNILFIFLLLVYIFYLYKKFKK